MPVSAATYERVALEDPESKWELVGCGDMRRKPAMSMEHNSGQRRLTYMVQSQLDFDAFEVAENTRVLIPGGRYFVPDLAVIPTALMAPRSSFPSGLEAYAEPLPLIVEVWSPSIGEYDVEEKLLHYQERGDLEIWRVHPYDETITTWVREADGSYTETPYAAGSVCPRYLPGVTVVLSELFR